MFSDSPLNNLCFSGREPGKRNVVPMFEPIQTGKKVTTKTVEEISPCALIGAAEHYLCGKCRKLFIIENMYSASICLSCWKGEGLEKSKLESGLQKGTEAARGASEDLRNPQQTAGKALAEVRPSTSDPTSRGWVLHPRSEEWRKGEYGMYQDSRGWRGWKGNNYLKPDGNWVHYVGGMDISALHFPTWEEIDAKLFPSKEETEPSESEGWKKEGYYWVRGNRAVAENRWDDAPRGWYAMEYPLHSCYLQPDGTYDNKGGSEIHYPSWALLKAAMKEMK